MRKTAAARKPAPIEPETITLPDLAKGEIYVGLMLKDGEKSHHLILLPGEAEAVTWSQAKTWAKKQGGELPARKEQALLFANAPQHFQPRWYWSSQQHAEHSEYAWMQDFIYGTQYYYHQGDEYRARAVRRVPIR